jgi:hypothetical protein
MLGDSDAPPFFDRAAVERIFGLRRRQAIALMHQVGGYRAAGRALLVSRDALLAFLRDPLRHVVAEVESRRFRSLSERLGEACQELHMRRVPVTAAPRVFHLDLNGLPPGVDLSSGELRVRFASPDELVEKLFALSQALAGDYETFARAWAEGRRS